MRQTRSKRLFRLTLVAAGSLLILLNLCAEMKRREAIRAVPSRAQAVREETDDRTATPDEHMPDTPDRQEAPRAEAVQEEWTPPIVQEIADHTSAMEARAPETPPEEKTVERDHDPYFASAEAEQAFLGERVFNPGKETAEAIPNAAPAYGPYTISAEPQNGSIDEYTISDAYVRPRVRTRDTTFVSHIDELHFPDD